MAETIISIYCAMFVPSTHYYKPTEPLQRLSPYVCLGTDKVLLKPSPTIYSRVHPF